MIRRAMFMELDAYWQGLNEARVTKSIHPHWEERKLPSFMTTRYYHTVMHRMALGRGPLRAVIHRKGEEAQQRCRYGCEAKESAEHVVMGCKHTQQQRENLITQCTKINQEFNMKTVFCEKTLQEDLEILIKTFINA